jgi:hypothetical protein
MRRAVPLVAALVLLPVVMASSCDTLDTQPGTVRVDAPDGKCWSGAIGDSSKDGCGPKSFEIKDEPIVGGNAQKTTEGPWRLTLTLEIDGKVVDTSTTTAEFGIAQVIEK